MPRIAHAFFEVSAWFVRLSPGEAHFPRFGEIQRSDMEPLRLVLIGDNSLFCSSNDLLEEFERQSVVLLCGGEQDLSSAVHDDVNPMNFPNFNSTQKRRGSSTIRGCRISSDGRAAHSTARRD